MTPGVYCPTSLEYSSIIQPIICGVVPTSGAGTSWRGTDVPPHLLHPAAAQAFLLGDGEGGRVDEHAALAAAQRDIGHGALPGHPGGQGAHGVERLGGVEANAALVGAAGIVVLDAVAVEDAQRAVVHAHRDAELELARGPAQDLRHLGVQVEQLGDVVELALRHFKCIDCFCHLILLLSEI